MGAVVVWLIEYSRLVVQMVNLRSSLKDNEISILSFCKGLLWIVCDVMRTKN